MKTWNLLESDSMHKVDIGGKGIGRFSWLKAFKKVIINSEYENINGKDLLGGILILKFKIPLLKIELKMF